MPDLSLVFRNLHSMTHAGLALAPGCHKLAATARPELATVWTQLATGLDAGEPLSSALANSTLPVEPWMLEMIQAGEFSGTIDQILEHLTTEVETRRSWRRSLFTRLLYPAIVLHLTALLPALPLLLNHGGTIALLWMGSFLTLIYLPLITGWSLKQVARQSPALQSGLERMLLGIPLAGAAIRAARSARFYRALSALARASSRWEQAVHSSALASGSARLQQSAADHHAGLAAGTELTPTLQQFHYFAETELELLHTGELTGTLCETLDRLSTAAWQTATQKLTLFSVALSMGVYALCVAGILLAILSILGPVYYQVYELLNY